MATEETIGLSEYYLEVLQGYLNGEKETKDLRPALIMFFDHLDNKAIIKDYIDEVPMDRFNEILKLKDTLPKKTIFIAEIDDIN